MLQPSRDIVKSGFATKIGWNPSRNRIDDVVINRIIWEVLLHPSQLTPDPPIPDPTLRCSTRGYGPRSFSATRFFNLTLRLCRDFLTLRIGSAHLFGATCQFLRASLRQITINMCPMCDWAPRHRRRRRNRNTGRSKGISPPMPLMMS